MLYFIQHLNYSTVNPVLTKPGHDENLPLAEKLFNPKYLESHDPNLMSKHYKEYACKSINLCLCCLVMGRFYCMYIKLGIF